MVDNKKLITGFSYLRVFGCICILLLHTINGTLGLYGDGAQSNQVILLKILLNLLLWCVPCYVMITGSLLLEPEKELSYTKIFKKYFLRIFKALIFCCILFGFFDVIVNHQSISISWIGFTFMQFISGTSWAHLWYLYLLLGLYLMLPIYRLIVKSAKKNDILYIIGLYFLFLSVLNIFPIFGVQIGFYILTTTIYPLYFILGYALNKKILCITKMQNIILFLFTSIILIIVTFMQTKIALDLNALLNYGSPLVVMQSMSIFNFFKDINWSSNKVIQSLDFNAFGIYLLHMVVVRWLLKYYGLNPFNGVVLLNILMIAIISFITSYSITFILKKIPIFQSFI